MGALFISLLSKLGIVFKGPMGLLGKLIMDRALIWLEKKIKALIFQIQEYFKEKKIEKVDRANEQKYDETLRGPEKPDATAPTQQEIDDATSDVLNSRKR